MGGGTALPATIARAIRWISEPSATTLPVSTCGAIGAARRTARDIEGVEGTENGVAAARAIALRLAGNEVSNASLTGALGCVCEVRGRGFATGFLGTARRHLDQDCIHVGRPRAQPAFVRHIPFDGVDVEPKLRRAAVPPRRTTLLGFTVHLF